MENIKNNGSNIDTKIKSAKEYYILLRNNLFPIILISVVSFAVAIVYAWSAQSIYKATTTIKISKPQGSILESPLMPEFQDFGSDRFIANEIEILKSNTIRQKVAQSLIDSFEVLKNTKRFHLMVKKESLSEKVQQLKSLGQIEIILKSYVTAEQKRGLDIVEISAESPEPSEAALIANCYAMAYKSLNLEVNRNQLTTVKKFLQEQRNEKQEQLGAAEEVLRSFQEKGGIISLDAQASNLITQLSTFEAEKNAAQIELMASDKMLHSYKAELEKQNPRLADYLKGLSSESYIKALQEQLAKLEINRDIAVSNKKMNSVLSADYDKKIKEYDSKISSLRGKLDEKTNLIRNSIFASSPTEVKELAHVIVEEEIKNQTLKIRDRELGIIVSEYEGNFNKLPKTSIELARYQRNREALEKLYGLVEEKYQEALINEQSQPGNVLIVDEARRPSSPSKPNRMLIVIVGFILGVTMSVGYVFIRNSFDNTVKTPEDIQRRNVNVLAWIPQIDGLGVNGNKELEFIVARKPDSIPSEAFKVLRTRVQFAKPDSGLKTILVTSSAPQEGKTTICVNLAGSFAQSNKRTLIIDCDLRKPRVHNVFGTVRTPGLVNHLFDKVPLEEIIRTSEIPNLFYIPTGTIPPNPAELLESNKMKDFIHQMTEKFDIVMLDSPPIIAVTDAEILSKIVDVSILVVSAETTELDIMEKSVEIMSRDNNSFIGAILNNFSYKAGYGSYYKYYYYYSHPKGDSKTTQSKA